MATKPTTPVKPVAAKPTYKQVTGTKANPATPYRALRQAKGYGRVALANALGITTSALWAIENHTPANSPAGKQAMAALRALPNVGKAATPAKQASKPATPATAVATPASLA